MTGMKRLMSVPWKATQFDIVAASSFVRVARVACISSISLQDTACCMAARSSY